MSLPPLTVVTSACLPDFYRFCWCDIDVIRVIAVVLPTFEWCVIVCLRLKARLLHLRLTRLWLRSATYASALIRCVWYIGGNAYIDSDELEKVYLNSGTSKG